MEMYMKKKKKKKERKKPVKIFSPTLPLSQSISLLYTVLTDMI